jgi:AcrR family transcriptional regulator
MQEAPKSKVKPKATRGRKPNAANGGNAPSRRDEILEAAAVCFASTGYDATTMRDIADKSGMMAGSIYYYFPSKEALLVAVHEEAVRRIQIRVEQAIRAEDDAWTQLLAASTAYLDALSSEDRFARVVVTEFPRQRMASIRAKLIEHRDTFEDVFRNLVAKLPLAPHINRRLWRIGLLSMLAWTMVWFRPDGGKPTRELAADLIGLLKERSAA